MKTKLVGLSSLIAACAFGVATAAPSNGNFQDQTSTSYLLWSNLYAYEDCSLVPEETVRIEIANIPQISANEALEGLIMVSEDSPCAGLQEFANEAIELADTDMALFMAKLGIRPNMQRASLTERALGAGSQSQQPTTPVAGPPPQQSGTPEGSDYN